MVGLSKEEILDKYKHLDQSDDFVGIQFPTPKGGVLTVVGWDGDRLKNGKRKFTVHCDVCSDDQDLWAFGEMKAEKNKLNTGRTPCGCANTPRWTEHQLKVLAKRECKRRGYIFNGWQGDFKGTKTKLDLINPETGNNWKSTTYNSFMNGRGDPQLKVYSLVERSTIDEDTHINELLSNGDFTKGTVFNKVDGVFWEYTCPVCSYDEYKSAGLCSGVFKKRLYELKRGSKSCRCSSKYRWTREQREWKVKGLCLEEGLRFEGWEFGYRNSRSVIVWTCARGHKCKTPVGEFINSGARCLPCSAESSNFNGYIHERREDTDYLYVMFSPYWIKCGRTFNVKGRLSNIKSSCKLPCEILFLYKGRHEDVYEIEQLVKEFAHSSGKNFYRKGEFAWKGNSECYTLDFIDNLGSLLSCFNTIEPIKTLQ